MEVCLAIMSVGAPGTLELTSESPNIYSLVLPGGNSLSVIPQRGGLISSWRVQGRELLYFDHERFADPGKSVRGGIPILFPICGNLPGNTLELAQRSFPIFQHGFARDLSWTLKALDNSLGIELSLCSDHNSLCHYPYPFRLSVRYSLEASSLAITVEVQQLSTGTAAMPFSFGLHPYFAVSALESVTVEGLPAQCFSHHTMAPTASQSELQRLPAGIDLLAGPAASVRLVDHGLGSAIEMQMQSPLDLAVVWTDPPRPMVCLEPWTAPRGALATGDRCLWLTPGESRRLQCRYSLLQS